MFSTLLSSVSSLRSTLQALLHLGTNPRAGLAFTELLFGLISRSNEQIKGTYMSLEYVVPHRMCKDGTFLQSNSRKSAVAKSKDSDEY